MRHFSLFCLRTLSALLLIVSSNTFAAYMNSNDLEKLAANFIQNHTHIDEDETISVKIANIQPGIKVPVCQNGLNINYPNNSSGTQVSTLELNCNDEANWRLYLPVEVSVLKTVIVAKENIFPHDKITRDKLTYALHNKKKLYHGYYSDIGEIEGLVASRLITAGRVINKKNIRDKIVIKRNQNVEIVSRHGFVEIKAHGIARTDGALNDIIKVYNPSSKRMIDATVIKPGLVEVV